MRAAFQRLLIQKGWAKPGTRLVAGISGGMDSMVLLHLLCSLSEEMSFFVLVAHLNHCLRGEESDRDEQFVREISERWGLSVEIGREDVGEIARREKLPVQVAARRVRYRFFEEVMKRHGGNYIVLGHQSDDTAETVMMRWLRGASVHGLRGIPLQNGSVIRPLLSFSRQEIAAYADENKVPYVEDSSNKKMTYLRNRVRHDLIPLIERKYQKAFSRHLARYARYFGEIHAYLSETCAGISKSVIGKNGEIQLKVFRGLHTALQRILMENYLLENGWIQEPLSFEQLEAILKIVKGHEGTRRFEFRRGVWIVREYDRLYVSEGLKGITIHPVTCSVPGSVLIEEIDNRLTVEEVSVLPSNLSSNAREAYVNGDIIGHDLLIRSFRPGDRIVTNGTVKLKKFFIDAKVPERMRCSIPLVYFNDSLICIGGLRVDRRYYVKGETRRVLHLHFQFPIEVA